MNSQPLTTDWKAMYEVLKECNTALEKRIEKALSVLAMGHTEREREAWRILKGEGDGAAI